MFYGINYNLTTSAGAHQSYRLHCRHGGVRLELPSAHLLEEEDQRDGDEDDLPTSQRLLLAGELQMEVVSFLFSCRLMWLEKGFTFVFFKFPGFVEVALSVSCNKGLRCIECRVLLKEG